MSRPPATTVYYGLEFLLSMPTWVVVAIYLVSDVGLTPFQLVVMGTAMEAAVFLFEVPTGVVADTYGRKLARHRVRRHGHGLAPCRARLRTMAALRPLGVVGHRVHLHERRLPGLITDEVGSRADPGRVPPGCAPVLRRSAAGPGSVGPDPPSPSGRRRRGRGGHCALRARVHRRDARDRLSAPASGGAQGPSASSAPRRSPADASFAGTRCC